MPSMDIVVSLHASGRPDGALSPIMQSSLDHLVFVTRHMRV